MQRRWLNTLLLLVCLITLGSLQALVEVTLSYDPSAPANRFQQEPQTASVQPSVFENNLWQIEERKQAVITVDGVSVKAKPKCGFCGVNVGTKVADYFFDLVLG